MSRPSPPLPIDIVPAAGSRHAWAGAIGAIVTLAVTLTLGVFAFAPLGSAAAQIGIAASFATCIVSATVMAMRSRASLPVAGPSSATALIFAALLTQLVAMPQGAAPSPDEVLLPVAAAVLLCGMLQLAMARAGLAKLVRFVPHPVLAGFMNGIAVLVVLAQVPALFALSSAAWRTQGLGGRH
jgi:SulP family sulfate permease